MTIQQARVFVGQQIGLPQSFDGSIAAYANLSASQQVQLTAHLIKYIAQNPSKFTAAQVATANAELGRADTLTISDTSFDFALFWNELEAEAIQTIGEPLQNIGDGISNTVGTFGKAIPFIVFGTLALFVYFTLKNNKLV